MSRPFNVKIGSNPSFVVIADTKALAEKFASEQANQGLTSETRPLNEAEYKTVDFKADTFARISGGKEDAVVTPFVFILGDDTSYGLAPSQAVAERHLAQLMKEKAVFEVSPVEAQDYPSIDWANAPILDSKKTEEKAEGDADKQTEMKGVPGFEGEAEKPATEEKAAKAAK